MRLAPVSDDNEAWRNKYQKDIAILIGVWYYICARLLVQSGANVNHSCSMSR